MWWWRFLQENISCWWQQKLTVLVGTLNPQKQAPRRSRAGNSPKHISCYVNPSEDDQSIDVTHPNFQIQIRTKSSQKQRKNIWPISALPNDATSKNRSLSQRFPPSGYGSIPINTIFSGMNIHKSQLFWCSPGVQGFDTLPSNTRVAKLLGEWHHNVFDHCRLREVHVPWHGTVPGIFSFGGFFFWHPEKMGMSWDCGKSPPKLGNFTRKKTPSLSQVC